jgi:hypothetical protein
MMPIQGVQGNGYESAITADENQNAVLKKQ